ncbi:MAG: hypothetical protein ACRDWX_03135 [Acidimicrobiia bacterium]
MSSWRGRVAWAVVALGAGVLGTVLWLEGSFTASVIPLGMFSFSVLGGLIIRRRPRNAIGWIYLVDGTLFLLIFLADHLLAYGLERGIPAEAMWPIAWYTEWTWIPALFLLFVFSLLLFPDGRLPSPSWRPVAMTAGALMVGFTLVEAFARQLDTNLVVMPNPVGFLPVDDAEEGIQGVLLVGGVVASMLAAAVSLVVRYRRSRGPERQQLKWFALSGGILVSGFLGAGLVDAFTGWRPWLVDALVLSAYPIGTGIAILRYRLYDIDLVINRTLVYGSLTVLLGAVYVAGVVGLPRLLPLAEDNDLVVAGSTLAMAALFNRFRRRIQSFVDRRFYRRRYDAQRTVEAFSQRLRDQVDLETLVADLQWVVRDTLRPASVGVWLREQKEVLH